jgi:signal transduction histidine kinase
LASLDGEAADARRLRFEFDRYFEEATRTSQMILAKSGDPTASIAEMQIRYRAIEDAVKGASTRAHDDFTTSLDSDRAGVRRIVWTTVLSAVAVIGALILISHYIVRSLWRQLGGDPEDARRFADRIAAGDLSAKIKVAPEDTGSLMASLQAMVVNGLLLDTALSPEQREFAEISRSSGQLLMELINDILDVSKIEAGGLELESVEFDVQSVSDAAVDAVALRASQKGLEFIVEVDPRAPKRFRGDTTRLRQILLNLLSNAIKFTERGEIGLNVAFDAAAIGTRTLEFKIHDTGIGIEAATSRTLFAPFKQADNSMTRKFGGTGLGLSICKSLAEAMGGIHRIGQRARRRFDISLPRAVARGRQRPGCAAQLS